MPTYSSRQKVQPLGSGSANERHRQVSVSFAFRNKPLEAVGYSGGIAGGVRAIEHLAQMAVEAGDGPRRTVMVVPQVTEAFNEAGRSVNPVAEITLDNALDDLNFQVVVPGA